MPVPVKFNKTPVRDPRVLIAPLDWGLGHATRCIPIIKELINQKCKVVVACAGAQKTLLREEFPALRFVELRGYEIKYDKNRALTILKLMCAIPKILIRIKQEKAWLANFAGSEGLDLVISDNRYGLVTAGIPCIFMTHQLVIKTPFGGWVDGTLQSLNYRVIRRFSRCWVPDTAAGGLAGELSHPVRMPPITTRYIGWLSRFGAGARGLVNGADGTGGPLGIGMADLGGSGGYLLALLSGPEPQRTLLENEILRQAAALALEGMPYACRLVILRGLPGGGMPLPGLAGSAQPGSSPLPAWITVYDHLPTRTLEPLLLGARLVLARPGYSTVMDLERLGKRALLVPTPGQTEQEYLGPYLAGKGWADCVDQRAFSLAKAFGLAMAGSGLREMEDSGLLADEIAAVLNLVK